MKKILTILLAIGIIAGMVSGAAAASPAKTLVFDDNLMFSLDISEFDAASLDAAKGLKNAAETDATITVVNGSDEGNLPISSETDGEDKVLNLGVGSFINIAGLFSDADYTDSIKISMKAFIVSDPLLSGQATSIFSIGTEENKLTLSSFTGTGKGNGLRTYKDGKLWQYNNFVSNLCGEWKNIDLTLTKQEQGGYAVSINVDSTNITLNNQNDLSMERISRNSVISIGCDTEYQNLKIKSFRVNETRSLDFAVPEEAVKNSLISDKGFKSYYTLPQGTSIQSTESITLQDNLTIESWINLKDLQGHSYNNIFSVYTSIKSNGQLDNYIIRFSRHSVSELRVFKNGSATANGQENSNLVRITGIAASAPILNDWCHVALTREKGTGEDAEKYFYKLYVNGAVYQNCGYIEAALVDNSVQQKIMIGDNYYADSKTGSLKVADFNYYTQALSETEIADIYNGTKDNFKEAAFAIAQKSVKLINGGMEISGSIYNADAENSYTGAKLIAAVYDGTKLMAVNVDTTVDIPAGKSEVPFRIVCGDSLATKDYTVKLFLWKDLNTLEPICENKALEYRA